MSGRVQLTFYSPLGGWVFSPRAHQMAGIVKGRGTREQERAGPAFPTAWWIRGVFGESTSRRGGGEFATAL